MFATNHIITYEIKVGDCSPRSLSFRLEFFQFLQELVKLLRAHSTLGEVAGDFEKQLDVFDCHFPLSFLPHEGFNDVFPHSLTALFLGVCDSCHEKDIDRRDINAFGADSLYDS